MLSKDTANTVYRSEVGMDNLDGLNYFMFTALMSIADFKYYQDIYSDLEIWKNSKTGKKFTIRKMKNFLPKAYLLKVLEQAGLSEDEFLKLA